MLREMSYSSLPQDESSASERSSFMTHGLIEYPHRSSSGSNQKIICFVVSFLLVTGATLAVVVPLMLDGPKASSSEGGDSSVPLSSQLNSGNFISNLYNKVVESVNNGTSPDVVTNSSDHQIQSNYTTHIEEVTVNPNDDKTWKVVNTESSNTSGEAVLNVTRLSVVLTTQADVIVTKAVQVDVTNSPQQELHINSNNATQKDPIAPEQPSDHSGSPWEQYTNTSYTDKTSVMSSLDNTTLVVLVALIVVSLSTLVAAVAFLIHVKIETKRRRQNIANVIHDLQSPDKIILLNSDESENSEESDDEYRRH